MSKEELYIDIPRVPIMQLLTHAILLYQSEYHVLPTAIILSLKSFLIFKLELRNRCLLLDRTEPAKFDSFEEIPLFSADIFQAFIFGHSEQVILSIEYRKQKQERERNQKKPQQGKT